jgi:seryl-tRNA synthetase
MAEAFESTHATVLRTLTMNILGYPDMLKNPDVEPLTDSAGYLMGAAGEIDKKIKDRPNLEVPLESTKANNGFLANTKPNDAQAMGKQIEYIERKIQANRGKYETAEVEFDEAKQNLKSELKEVFKTVQNSAKPDVAIGSQTTSNIIKKQKEKFKKIGHDITVANKEAQNCLAEIHNVDNRIISDLPPEIKIQRAAAAAAIQPGQNVLGK